MTIPQLHLPPAFTTVTKLSKAIAVLLFITLPFFSFYLGVSYQKAITVSNVEAPGVDTSPKIATNSPRPPTTVVPATESTPAAITSTIKDFSFPEMGISLRCPSEFNPTFSNYNGQKSVSLTYVGVHQHDKMAHEDGLEIGIYSNNIKSGTLFDVVNADLKKWSSYGVDFPLTIKPTTINSVPGYLLGPFNETHISEVYLPYKQTSYILVGTYSLDTNKEDYYNKLALPIINSIKILP